MFESKRQLREDMNEISRGYDKLHDRIMALEYQLDKLVADLKDTNTRVSRVTMATGLTAAEIYREKAK